VSASGIVAGRDLAGPSARLHSAAFLTTKVVRLLHHEQAEGVSELRHAAIGTLDGGHGDALEASLAGPR
jgi:hypothetical protein